MLSKASFFRASWVFSDDANVAVVLMSDSIRFDCVATVHGVFLFCIVLSCLFWWTDVAGFRDSSPADQCIHHFLSCPVMVVVVVSVIVSVIVIGVSTIRGAAKDVYRVSCTYHVSRRLGG